MKDNLVTLLSKNGGIVVHAIDSTDIVTEMERLHQTSATASAALGRLLTAAALMGIVLKDSAESVTLTINGKGPVGTLVAIGDHEGNVRGSIGNPLADAPLNAVGKLDVGGIVGTDGMLTVIRNTAAGEPYTGQVPIVSGEIAEDITSYFAQSEQIPTVCALGVLVNPDLTIRAAGGFLLQLMPGSDDAEITLVEDNIAALDPVTSLLNKGLTPRQIAERVLEGFEPRLLTQSHARYICNCSREKMARILVTLGKQQLEELAEERPETELVCSYCNKKYLFSSDELLALID